MPLYERTVVNIILTTATSENNLY